MRITADWIETCQGRLFASQWYPHADTDLAPLVLFHDSLGSVALWRDFPARLCQATGRRIVAYDRLGFGRSDPYPGRLPLSFVRDEAQGAFQAVYAALKLEQFIAFGHSVGGGMAVVTAGAYPEACQALITESAQTFAEDLTLAGIRAARQAFSQPQQRERLQKYHGDKTEWVLSAWIDTWLSEDFQVWTLDQALSRVTCPVLVLHGDQDEYGSSTHPERIAALTQGPAELHILPDCGHVPHREHEATVLSLVESFLGKLA